MNITSTEISSSKNDSSIGGKTLLLLLILILFFYNCSPKRTMTSGDPHETKDKSTPIVKAIVNVVPEKTYYNSKGDIWISTWADDDNIYSINGDGSGFGSGEGDQVRLSKLIGSDPNDLQGSNVPGISDYSSKFIGSTKTMGITCIDGVLYAALNGMGKGGKKNQAIPIPSAYGLAMHNCTILKSSDHGLTWIPAPNDTKDHYTFPQISFPAASFINYGKDGSGRPVPDRSDKYVYLTSNDVGWSNGDFYMLARVARAKLLALNSADYQFYKGGDGLSDANWSNNAADAGHIIDNPGKCGMSCVQYNPVLKRYIMVGWFFTETYPTNDSYSILTVYESPTPWGKWTLIGLSDAYPYGWYDPGILGKFTSTDGKAMKLIVGSDAPQGDKFTSPLQYYHANILNMKLYTDRAQVPLSPKNTNLNLLKPATSSSVYQDSPAFAAERINDGNKLTRRYFWQPKTGKNEWACIDFGQLETINATRIFEFCDTTGGPAVESYKIQYWDQLSVSWKNAVSNSNGIGNCKTDIFLDIKTNKLRLFICSTRNNTCPKILEFQAFNRENPVKADFIAH